MELPTVLEKLLVGYLDFCTDEVPIEWNAFLLNQTLFENWVDEFGNLRHYVNNKLHRKEADGPAIECPNGNTRWYKNDRPHRLHGPAFDYADKKQE